MHIHIQQPRSHAVVKPIHRCFGKALQINDFLKNQLYSSVYIRKRKKMSEVNLTDDAKSAKNDASLENPGAPENVENGQNASNQIIVKMEDVLTIDPDATDVDLNHGRIGKIENLEPLVNLER